MNRRLFLKGSIALSVSSIGAASIVPKDVLGKSTEKLSIEEKHLRFNIALKNLGNTQLQDAFLWIYAPVSSYGQKLKNLKASQDFSLEPDVLDQNIMKFKFSKIEPFSTKLMTVTAQIEMLPKRKTDLPNPPAWLQDEYLIEATNPQIKTLASQLMRDTAANTSHAIYKWVSESLKYSGYVADNLGALYALRELKGDCTEYACLAIALARANGIPARLVGGYFLERSGIARARDYHHWAEVYFDGRWHLLDAQKRNWLNPSDNYIAYTYYQMLQPTKMGALKRYKLSEGLSVVY